MTDLERVKKIKELINYAAEMYESSCGEINYADVENEDDFVELKFFLMDLYNNYKGVI